MVKYLVGLRKMGLLIVDDLQLYFLPFTVLNVENHQCNDYEQILQSNYHMFKISELEIPIIFLTLVSPLIPRFYSNSQDPTHIIIKVQ